MDAARHQIVARALGRGRGQDRRLELEEALLLHPPPQRIDDRAAQHDVVVQPLAPQVEEAVTQPRIFRIIRIAEHLDRQFAGRAQHLDLGDEHLDLSGGKIGIGGAVRTGPHLAVDSDHPFGAHLLGRLEGRAVRVGDDLGQAVMVPQIDEQEAAMVADAVAPAGKADGLADVGGAKRAAAVRTVAMHGKPVEGAGLEHMGRSPCQGTDSSLKRDSAIAAL